jgi:hypothetical protein
MAVYIRKLANRRNVENILSSATVEDVCADSISAEFRTKGNRLSIWEAPDEDIDLGILAIALSSSKIEAMDFIVLAKQTLEKAGLTVEKSKPSANPLIQAEDMHYDISDIRLRDFARLTSVYKITGADEALIKRCAKAQLKEKIGRAKSNGWINSANANDEIKKTIDAL